MEDERARDTRRPLRTRSSQPQVSVCRAAAAACLASAVLLSRPHSSEQRVGRRTRGSRHRRGAPLVVLPRHGVLGGGLQRITGSHVRFAGSLSRRGGGGHREQEIARESRRHKTSPAAPCDTIVTQMPSNRNATSVLGRACARSSTLYTQRHTPRLHRLLDTQA